MIGTPAATETQLLHQGGRPGTWGSLGLWNDGSLDYAGACTALAQAVGQAARLQAGDRVLAVACGAGDELRLWSQDFGARSVLGIELNAQRVASATRLCAAWPGITVRQGSGTALATLGLPRLQDGSFDRVLCVDAAYHLRPRSAFLTQAWRLLRPGGTLAYTHLLLDHQRSAWKATLLAASARVCGLAADDLCDDSTQLKRLLQAGFEAPKLQRLDDAVLGGFTRFVQKQSTAYGLRAWLPAWHPAWRRVAITARLIPPCRSAGLGYALLSATRPGTAAFSAAATA